eukprot:scaffold122793_cov64-Cyclotella_meneghiniana.AAC.2
MGEWVDYLRPERFKNERRRIGGTHRYHKNRGPLTSRRAIKQTAGLLYVPRPSPSNVKTRAISKANTIRRFKITS